MLVLTRKVKQKIIINKNIEVKVLSVDRNNVKIGIEAPREMPVDREEIYVKKYKKHPDRKTENIV